MEELFECTCGCTEFVNVVPHEYKKQDINNWASFGLKVYAGIAPVLICVNCNRITIPPISMSGKSRLDPNVQAFGRLMNWVEKHNELPKEPEVVVALTGEIVVVDEPKPKMKSKKVKGDEQ